MKPFSTFPESDTANARPDAICRRLRDIVNPEDRQLLWFLNACRLEDVTRDLIAMFPDRLHTKTLSENPSPIEGIYPVDVAERIHDEIQGTRSMFELEWITRPELTDQECSRDYLMKLCIETAETCLLPLLRGAVSTQSYRETRTWRNGKYVTESIPVEEHIAKHPFPPAAEWFQDLPGALREYARRKSSEAADGYYLTNIGRKIWETLDWCLQTRRSCVIEGDSGRGKSATLSAFAASHRGQVRVFSVPGYGCQRDVFHALASALGLPASSSKAASEMRFRLEDILRRSRLALVIDEAHHLLNHRSGDGRPPLIDWIDTALVEKGIPVVLCVTPQFAKRLNVIERSSGYNADQFRRRFASRWETLPSATAPEDLAALAARMLPSVGARGHKMAVAYASTQRDVSGLADLARDAKCRAEQQGRQVALFEDFWRALEGDRLPSDNAMSAAFARPDRRRRNSSASLSATPTPEVVEEAQEDRSTPTVVRRGGLGIGCIEPRSRNDFGAVNEPLSSPVLDRRQAPDSAQALAIKSPVAA